MTRSSSHAAIDSALRGDDSGTGSDEEAGGTRFDPCVLVLGLWTVACNTVVFSGGGLRTLAWVFAASGALCGGFVWLRGRRRGSEVDSGKELTRATEVPSAERARSPGPRTIERVFVLAVACAAVALAQQHENALYLWLIGMPLCIFCVWRKALLGCAWEPPVSGRGQTAALWAIAWASLVLTLVGQRPDFDDAFYINLAVHAADHPDAALLASDTMHGIAGIPLSLSVYRVQSYELLGGLLAWLTPLAALDCFHVLFPALAAFAIPFALAALLRVVVPRVWIFGVLFGVLFLWSTGIPQRGFGNLSFMRLQQGKSILLSLVIPLVCFYGLRFARRPRLREGVLLAAIQVVALGANATALWLAPTCGFLAVCAGAAPTRKRWRVLGCALLCSLYPVLVGISLYATTTSNLEAAGVQLIALGPFRWGILLSMLAVLSAGLWLQRVGNRTASALGLLAALALALWVVFIGWVAPGEPAGWMESCGLGPPAYGRVKLSFEKVLGYGPSGSLFAIALLGGWALAVDALHRRVCALFACAFFVVFWNPFLAEHLAERLTGGVTYWRVFWILPAAAWTGAIWAALIDRVPIRAHRAWTVALVAGACLTLVLTPERSTLAAENQVEFRAPGWRIRPAESEAVEALVAEAGPRTFVLAPESVSAWVPMLHDHPFPLVVRRLYMNNLKGHLDEQEIEDRTELARMVAGERPMIPARLLKRIAESRLSAVCVAEAAAARLGESAAWQESMRKVFDNGAYQVWGIRE